MSVLPLTKQAGWTGCSALFILIVLLPEATPDILNATAQVYGGGSQCGEYTNQVTAANKRTQVSESSPQIHRLDPHFHTLSLSLADAPEKCKAACPLVHQ